MHVLVCGWRGGWVGFVLFFLHDAHGKFLFSEAFLSWLEYIKPGNDLLFHTKPMLNLQIWYLDSLPVCTFAIFSYNFSGVFFRTLLPPSQWLHRRSCIFKHTFLHFFSCKLSVSRPCSNVRYCPYHLISS